MNFYKYKSEIISIAIYIIEIQMLMWSEHILIFQIIKKDILFCEFTDCMKIFFENQTFKKREKKRKPNCTLHSKVQDMAICSQLQLAGFTCNKLDKSVPLENIHFRFINFKRVNSIWCLSYKFPVPWDIWLIAHVFFMIEVPLLQNE